MLRCAVLTEQSALILQFHFFGKSLSSLVLQHYFTAM
jgi:hypothetical protein